MVRIFRSILFYLSSQTRPNQPRRFGISGNRRPRHQVWAQGLQDVKDPSYHYSRLNRVLPGYIHVSLRTRDDTAIGEGKHPLYLE